MRDLSAPPPESASAPASGATENPVAIDDQRSYNRSNPTVRSRRLSAARRVTVPGQRRPDHDQPPTGDPGVSATATRPRAPLEGHRAVPHPDDRPPTDDTELRADDDLTPPDDAPPARRQRLITPLPLHWIREHAEAMTDIGVPGHMLDAYPPDEFLPMDDLRLLLSATTTPLAKRDAVWRYLIDNITAGEQRERWYIFAIGVAAMRLLSRADYITPGGQHGDHDDKRQVHQHLAVGFLAELHRIKPGDVRLDDRVLWRAVSRAKHALWRNAERPWAPLPGEPVPPATPKGKRKRGKPDEAPDDELAPALRALVVATADVKGGRTDRRPKITAQDAALLALCSLYGRTVPQAAEELGMTAAQARTALPTVKRAVFDLLASHYLKAKHPELGTGYVIARPATMDLAGHGAGAWPPDLVHRLQHRPFHDRHPVEALGVRIGVHLDRVAGQFIEQHQHRPVTGRHVEHHRERVAVQPQHHRTASLAAGDQHRPGVTLRRQRRFLQRAPDRRQPRHRHVQNRPAQPVRPGPGRPIRQLCVQLLCQRPTPYRLFRDIPGNLQRHRAVNVLVMHRHQHHR